MKNNQKVTQFSWNFHEK